MCGSIDAGDRSRQILGPCWSERGAARLGAQSNETLWNVKNPGGKHAIAAGLDAPATVEIEGPVGYYCAGMNKHGTVIVRGNAGTGVAEKY